MDWFLYDNGVCHERVKEQQILNQGGATCEQTETVKKESSNSGAPRKTLLQPMIQILTSHQPT